MESYDTDDSLIFDWFSKIPGLDIENWIRWLRGLNIYLCWISRGSHKYLILMGHVTRLMLGQLDPVRSDGVTDFLALHLHTQYRFWWRITNSIWTIIWAKGRKTIGNITWSSSSNHVRKVGLFDFLRGDSNQCELTDSYDFLLIIFFPLVLYLLPLWVRWKVK